MSPKISPNILPAVTSKIYKKKKEKREEKTVQFVKVFSTNNDTETYPLSNSILTKIMLRAVEDGDIELDRRKRRVKLAFRSKRTRRRHLELIFLKRTNALLRRHLRNENANATPSIIVI